MESSGMELPLHRFSGRAQGVLQRLNVTTIERLTAIDWATVECRQLGAGTRAELRAIADQLRDSQKTPREPLSTLPGPAAPSHVFPPDHDLVNLEDNRLDLNALWPVVVRHVLKENPRSYQVLSWRFGLEDGQEKSLHDIGLQLNVSRERVRQLEAAALQNLTNYLMASGPRAKEPKLHPAILQEVTGWNGYLEQVGFPISHSTVLELWQDRYGGSLSPQVTAFATLLLEVLGLVSFRLGTPDVPFGVARFWVKEKADRSFVVVALRAMWELLHQTNDLVSAADLQAAVNRSLEHQHIAAYCDAIALRRLLNLSDQWEEPTPDYYQSKFKYLISNVQQVERIMREWAKEGKSDVTFQDLVEEINHRHALDGIESDTNQSTVKSAYSRSSKRMPIGRLRARKWSPKEYSGEPRAVHEILEEYLLARNCPCTVAELTEYVAARRPVSAQTIASLLAQHEIFQRVGRGIYALRDWGMAEELPARIGDEYRHQFDDALAEIFLANNGQPIPLTELNRRLMARFGGQESTFRRPITDSPWIDLKPMDNFRLIAHWRDAPKETAERTEGESMSSRTHAIALRVLSSASSPEIDASRLVTLVQAETSFSRSFIYTALRQCHFLERKEQPEGLVYRLKET